MFMTRPEGAACPSACPLQLSSRPAAILAAVCAKPKLLPPDRHKSRALPARARAPGLRGQETEGAALRAELKSSHGRLRCRAGHSSLQTATCGASARAPGGHLITHHWRKKKYRPRPRPHPRPRPRATAHVLQPTVATPPTAASAPPTISAPAASSHSPLPRPHLRPAAAQRPCDDQPEPPLAVNTPRQRAR